jgi:hypothetical protein
LRRAIADLRDALDGGPERTHFLKTDQGKTQLEEEFFGSDAASFERLLAGKPEADGFDLRAAEAVALYGGPLLAPFDEDWIFAYRRQYEEMYCRAVADLCNLLGSRGQAKEGARISHSAIVLAPMREEPYIASIRAYSEMGNKSMALQQYEALEKMLDDHFGQTPSEAAQVALECGQTSQGERLPESTSASGGAIHSESRFYVERQADKTVDEALAGQEAVVLVFGPRQTGKTSMLARSTAKLRRQGARIAVSDFQSLGKAEIERPATLYRALIHSFASQLGLEYQPSWNEWVGPNSNLDTQIDILLGQTAGPVCWAMDEVDRLFGTDYADDFFGLVRSWHNRRALDPDGPWKRLSLLISYATEAHLFIKDLNQSPFNVGLRVNLKDFTESEVRDLGHRYCTKVGSHGPTVYDLTRGHPFLTRRAFSYLHSGGSIESLQQEASNEGGPFGDHLKQMLNAVQKDPNTEGEIRRLLDGQPFENPNLSPRLTAAGLLNPGSPLSPIFRVPCYEQFLRAAI